ncbi:tRNA delta(2)-isopentenylpyrophosphate transferase [Handroanthus impetiginosus]|uniref:adenylate dimethylallyltransferase (ADP/ATP-dependent) n=1 Tax=Handroanthus impetiginosus TaxID=429701 RepID=A0A2G9HTI9_9LAMI|nr:tRNA delta(2)-isopentenylpyrophosphate transferase [Handroanthus impetiginosus]
MNISFPPCKQTQPMVNFPRGLINIPLQRQKDKVVVVMGATGAGKSRLSIDLATRFDAEIINSDKMQAYRGLNIATNKVNDEECRGVPHHLLGFIDPEEDFTADNFVYHASLVADAIRDRGRLPIIAGGSNSFIKALVDDNIEFRSRYDCCFLWVDVAMPILHSFVSKRVDQMVGAGLVNEVREFFEPGGNYSRGIRRAIGVPEMDEFFRNETFVDGVTRAKLLEVAIDQIKANNRNLASRQLQNILRLEEQLELRLHRLNATEAFLKRGEESDEAWERLVADPSTIIVERFLCKDRIDIVSTTIAPPPMTATATAASVILGSTNTTIVAAATH